MRAKAAAYDHQRRDEVIPYVPTNAARVLDIGCAAGEFGAALREARPNVVVDGIESDHTAAEAASAIYRFVYRGQFPTTCPDHLYDTIVCNDVLEHMVDPWSAVESMRSLLDEHGCVVASIPNMRHWSALRPLLLQGRWDYQDHGILDRTHLRWFTRVTIAEMFQDASFEVLRLEPLSWSSPTRLYWRIARHLAPRLIEDLMTKQYVIVARATTPPTGKS